MWGSTRSNIREYKHAVEYFTRSYRSRLRKNFTSCLYECVSTVCHSLWKSVECLETIAAVWRENIGWKFANLGAKLVDPKKGKRATVPGGKSEHFKRDTPKNDVLLCLRILITNTIIYFIIISFRIRLINSLYIFLYNLINFYKGNKA